MIMQDGSNKLPNQKHMTSGAQRDTVHGVAFHGIPGEA